jgi:hypothetical protein
MLSNIKRSLVEDLGNYGKTVTLLGGTPIALQVANILRFSDNINLTSGEKDTLVALVEYGPLWDGDVPSKVGRDSLLQKDLAIRVVVKGEDGWQAATYKGRDMYMALFPGPDGPANTINEAKNNRKLSLT